MIILSQVQILLNNNIITLAEIPVLDTHLTKLYVDTAITQETISILGVIIPYW
jgi:hypothetical protein